MSNTEKFFGRHSIVGDDGSPYMTRYWIGRMRLHIFYRGDSDADPHDHPWDFWTFPLTSYVEEYVDEAVTDAMAEMANGYEGYWGAPRGYYGATEMQKLKLRLRDERWRIVKAFKLHFRKATHTHRVIGRHGKPGKIVTIVWRGKARGRKWGFLHRDEQGRRCWVPWRTYLYEGGKQAPCGPVPMLPCEQCGAIEQFCSDCARSLGLPLPTTLPLNINPCIINGAVCQYAIDIGMPEHRCVGRCQYRLMDQQATKELKF